MRILVAIVVLMAAVVALHAPADARKAKRAVVPHDYSDDYADPPHYRRGQPRHYRGWPRYSREEVECERARHADPTGTYAAYPCWAREALSPSDSGRGRSR
jgi:hypothetical protein